MELSQQTILITGGATGIGLALAEEFLARNNKVLLCGRREEKLREAQKKNPVLLYRVCDISHPSDRNDLVAWAQKEGVTILINNAGMQRQIDLTQGLADLESGDNEVRINLEATIYLSVAMIPHLRKQPNAAIANVTSGLAFVPIAALPIYCATKAAVHSFTVSLRHQLRNSRVRVFEIIPPTVDTELDRGTRAKRGLTDRGISAEQAARETIEGMEQDKDEIIIARAAALRNASGEGFEQLFQRMNGG